MDNKEKYNEQYYKTRFEKYIGKLFIVKKPRLASTGRYLFDLPTESSWCPTSICLDIGDVLFLVSVYIYTTNSIDSVIPHSTIIIGMDFLRNAEFITTTKYIFYKEREPFHDLLKSFGLFPMVQDK